MKDIFKVQAIIRKMPKGKRPNGNDLIMLMSGNNKSKNRIKPYVDPSQLDGMISVIERESKNAIAFLNNEKSKLV